MLRLNLFVFGRVTLPTSIMSDNSVAVPTCWKDVAVPFALSLAYMIQSRSRLAFSKRECTERKRSQTVEYSLHFKEWCVLSMLIVCYLNLGDFFNRNCGVCVFSQMFQHVCLCVIVSVSLSDTQHHSLQIISNGIICVNSISALKWSLVHVGIRRKSF